MKEKLNKLHFCYYLIESKLHFLSNKINPFLLLYRIPNIKKRMKDKYDIDNPIEWYNEIWTNKRNGFGLWFSGGCLIGLLFITFMSMIIFIDNIFDLSIDFNRYHWIVVGMISYLICYFYVFRNDNYLTYFKKFDKWEKSEKRKNMIMSIILTILMTTLFFTSML